MTKSCDVAVVGAGIAGLAAARALRQAGYGVVVWEKTKMPGGRIATRRAGGCVFDLGAQNLKPAGTALESALPTLAPTHQHSIDAPICLHRDGAILPGDPAHNAEAKLAFSNGLDTLPRELARGLDVRFRCPVERIDRDGDGFLLHTLVGQFAARRVIVALPAPQAAELLVASGLETGASPRIEALRAVQYTRCLTVALRYNRPAAFPFYALLAQDRAHPLLWLAVENWKGRTPQGQTALVAQLGHEASLELWDEPGERIVQAADWIGELLGQEFRVPAWHAIQRWPLSLPREPTTFEAVNPPGAEVIICGDGTAAGRVPDAYASGLKAAAVVSVEW